jgi:hypothetical protein
VSKRLGPLPPTTHDRGTPIYVRFVDRYYDSMAQRWEDRPLDTTAATTRIHAVMPGGGSAIFSMTPSTRLDLPPEDGWAEFAPTDTDASGYLSAGGAGEWLLRPEYQMAPGQRWRVATPISFLVSD